MKVKAVTDVSNLWFGVEVEGHFDEKSCCPSWVIQAYCILDTMSQ